jgi:hypothetical protein
MGSILTGDHFSPFLLVSLLLVPGVLHASRQETRDVPTIGEIEIIVNEIFEEGAEEIWGWAYRLANKLHVRTREQVVRQELLFSSGDPLDPEALAQTERNLRALVFLRDARIETHPTEQDEVDVRVITYDAWTTVPQIRFSKVGNKILWGVGAAERNLLGWGKWLEIGYRSDIDRSQTQFLYHDPRLVGSRIATTVSYAHQSDGSRGLLALTRPFFALSTAWAFGLRVEGFDQFDPLYAHGEKVDELRHVRRHGDVELARAVARSGPTATRLHIAYRSHEDEVEGDLRDFGVLQGGASTTTHRFLKLTHINRFERVEDFNLGATASAFLGASTPALGGEEGTVWFFSLNGSRGFQVGPAHFFTGGASWGARHRRGEWQNSLAAVRLDYFNKHKSRWLLVGTARLLYGGNLDPEIQIRLGTENGLRGYPVRQFVGDRSFRMSIEERFFISDDVLQLMSLGVAAFFDTGYAWPEGRSIRLQDLKSDVGLSFLVGRNRISSTTPGFRFDLAYALSPIEGRSRWLFSIRSRIEL